MIAQEIKDTIDNMSYEQLLRRWRFADLGDPIFIGEIGKYYQKVMFNKRDDLTFDEKVKVSKRIGWEE